MTLKTLSSQKFVFLPTEMLTSARHKLQCSILPQVDPKGSTLLVGFDDGVVRALTFQEKDEVDVHGRKVKDMTELVLKQAFKPHSGRVTALGMDHTAEVLATGVSPYV